MRPVRLGLGSPAIGLLCWFGRHDFPFPGRAGPVAYSLLTPSMAHFAQRLNFIVPKWPLSTDRRSEGSDSRAAQAARRVATSGARSGPVQPRPSSGGRKSSGGTITTLVNRRTWRRQRMSCPFTLPFPCEKHRVGSTALHVPLEAPRCMSLWRLKRSDRSGILPGTRHNSPQVATYLQGGHPVRLESPRPLDYFDCMQSNGRPRRA